MMVEQVIFSARLCIVRSESNGQYQSHTVSGRAIGEALALFEYLPADAEGASGC